MKVAILGAIGVQKGYKIIEACARDAAARKLPLQFIVIGFTEDDATLLEAGPVFITGRYDEEEVQALLDREAPNVAFYASVTPETWCYSLSHAIEADLPSIAFDLGAIGERLRASRLKHKLIKLGMAPSAINDVLLEFAAYAIQTASTNVDPSSGPVKVGDNSSRALYRAPSEGSITLVSSREDDWNYRLANFDPRLDWLGLSGEELMQASSGGLASSVEVLTLQKGVYVFTVRSGAPRHVGEDGALVLPAVHVGLGPGIAEGAVDFMSGLRNGAGWLFETRDVLVVRINTAGSHLIVTSIRAEGMAPLAIEVERMDSRRPTEGAAAIPAPAAPQLIAAAPQRPPATIGAMIANGRPPLRSQINLHLQGRGPASFSDGLWAGANGAPVAIEAMAIIPLEGLTADKIQYKALAANGYETPWTSGGAMCGAKGLEAPLIGFAIRLAKGAEAEYDVAYRGQFRNGATIGPLYNGAPCQISGAHEYLDAIEVAITRKAAMPEPGPAGRSAPQSQPQAPQQRPPQGMAPPQPQPAAARKIGPKFSIFREEQG